MNRLVFDIEANGLLEEATSIHCISFKNLNFNISWTLSGNQLNKFEILKAFKGPDRIIGHNIIGYDLPLLNKLYNIDLIAILGNEAIVDTLILSQVLNPDREVPRGCPTTIRNPVTNRSKTIGPHGLESWGYRVGFKKLEIHDWREFTPEMIERCEGDVIINEQVYYALLKEANLDNY
jgi:hypothetical protein